MRRFLRRIVLLGLFVTAGYVAYQRLAGRSRREVLQSPAWSRLPVDAEAATAQPSAGSSVSPVASAAPRWVEPVDGGVPDGYPIKVNEGSGIFHVPGGRFYDRTKATRCYATVDDALADGYRAAKA